MKKRISSLVDDKIRYANQRVTEEMCKDEPYRLLSYGRLEDLNDVDPVKLYQYYQQLLAENPMDFYVIGDVQIDEVREAVEQFFKLNRQNVRHIDFNPVQKKRVEEKIVIDQMDVGQGKLNIRCVPILHYRMTITRHYLSIMEYWVVFRIQSYLLMFVKRQA